MPTDQNQIVELPIGARSASLSSFSEKENTAEMVFSTGSRVLRSDWLSGERWYEELSMDPAHVRLKRVSEGAVPFLKDHGSWGGAGIDDVMGRLTEASVDGKQGIAKVKFSEREEVQPYLRDIRSGILPSVSVGYAIHRMEKVGEENGIPVLRAVDWEVFEVSSVAMPADSNAKFRSARTGERGENPRLFRCEVRGVQLGQTSNSGEAAQIVVESARTSPDDQKTGENKMPTEAEIQATAELETKRAAELSAAKAEGIKLERERQVEIRKMVRAAKLDESFGEELIKDEKITVDAARSRVIDKLAETDSQTRTASPRIESGSQDEVETTRGAIAEAILHRGDAHNFKMTDRARNFSGMTLMEMAMEAMRRRGVSIAGLSRQQIAQRAMHSSSDFPFITENVLNKTLRQSFQAAPQTFASFTRRVQSNDFKQISRTQLGMGSALSEVAENGEITYGTMGEAAEKYAVKQYAKGMAIGYQALINDDLDAFVRIPSQMGAKAKSLESDVVWAIITANAAMADGVALFHATHGNLAAVNAAIAIASLGIGRGAVRIQKEMDGEPLNLPVAYLAVPTALETVAEQYISQVQANVQTSNNPFAVGGRTPLSLIVEPRLDAASATAWYLFSQLGLIDMVELATLSGSTEPEIVTEMGFDTMGVKLRVSHSVGAKAIDWRGMFKNAGV